MLHGRRPEGDRLIALVAGLATIPAGVLVGLHPTEFLLGALLCGAVVACTVAPVRYLPALLLGASVFMPTLVLKGIAGSGEARLVAGLVLLALVRALVARPEINLPSQFPLAMAAALGLTLVTAAVALRAPPDQVGTSTDLLRDLSFPFAAVVGLLGGREARAAGRPLAVPRSFAVVGILASLACVDYWAWVKLGAPPLSGGLFAQVEQSSAFVGRAIFPFVQDAPNVGSVIFMLLAAFASPPLLLAPARGDRVLGLTLLITSLGAVLATQSRTGLIAAAAGSLTYVVFVKRGGRRRSSVVITLVFLAVVGGYVFTTFPRDRLNADTLQARVLIWKQALTAFYEAPVLGHGYLYSKAGNFVEAPAPNGTTPSRSQSAHSDLLSALDDGGLVGGAIFLAVILLMFRCGVLALGRRESLPMGIGYCCMLVVLITGGIDNTTSQSALAATIEWLTFGIVVGLTPPALSLTARAIRPSS